MVDSVTILSLFVGSLGLQTTVVGGWMRWRQTTVGRQNAEEEEETVTLYESKDTVSSTELGQANGSPKRNNKDHRVIGWEFKIVRANRDLFRDSAVLHRLCEEEATAGWIMLEKLDDRRIRFKRPISLREIIKADFLPFDPYRSHYGSSSSLGIWLVVIGALVVLTLPAYLGYVLVSTTLSKQPDSAKPPTPTLSPSTNPPSPNVF